jgi:hypothetical protein
MDRFLKLCNGIEASLWAGEDASAVCSYLVVYSIFPLNIIDVMSAFKVEIA